MLWRRTIAQSGWPLWLAAVLTGLLAYSAFVPLEWDEVAWLAYVPLIWVLLRPLSVSPFRIGFLAGAVFWLTSIFWLTEVSWFGWMLLALYCALYTGAFAWAVHSLAHRLGITQPEQEARGTFGVSLILMIAIPMLWVGLEFLRSVLFTGFAWNPLGASQFQRIALMQTATVTGVYGISAAIILLNVAITLTLKRYLRDGLRGRRPWHPELIIAFAVLAALILPGGQSIRRAKNVETTPLRSAVIQPNIPQYQKWTPEFVDHIYEQLESLSRLAIRASSPDWVIWPETAVPDYVRESERSYGLVRALATQGVSMLIGSMDIEWQDDGTPRYFNSSFLFDSEGHLVEVYDKQHLVMFGEYVPLGRQFPFLNVLTPIEASFDAGTESTVFTLPDPEIQFAALICFEDTVAVLGRRAVRKGARLLVNQTNVAWFRESAASRQHMVHSVLRAVENRVPVIRSANTGVSVGIDRFGRLHDMLIDETGNTFIAGFSLVQSDIPAEDMRLTLYTQWGDWFGWLGVLVLVWVSSPTAIATWRTWRQRGNV